MSWTHPDLEALADLVNQRTGLSFVNRQASAELGMRRAMASAGVHEPAAYAAQLANDQDALDDLINELTVGETYFFREPNHFDFVACEILPDLQRRRGSAHPLRAWSASCASGEEAYSLAILFQESQVSSEAMLVATDISRSALAKARRAVFGDWSLRGDGRRRAMPYLTQVGKEFRLDDRIRHRVAFSYLNLALDAYPSFATGIWGMDLILCRNVLIYFDRATVRQVAQRLYHTLADGGWLITASADPPLWEDAAFEVVSRPGGLYYRRAGAAVVPPMVQPDSSEDVVPVDFAARTPARLMAAPAEPTNRLDEARRALAGGDYARAVERTSSALDDAASAAVHVRALANLDAFAARARGAEAVRRHPLCAELHYLHAVLLLDARRPDDALQAMRRVLYLDRNLAIAHFTLGSIFGQRGDKECARRAYRNARDLCAGRPSEEPVPLADGESAGRLFEVACTQLALLDAEVA